MGFDYLYPYWVVREQILKCLDKAKMRRELKRKYLGAFKEKRRQNPKTAFLLMTPAHENLGDHAIALSETEFLKAHGMDYVEITSYDLETLQRYDMMSLMNGCPILMQGGGYLGTFWFQCEEMLRQLIEKNPRSPIVLMPNTIYYEPTPFGQEEFSKSVTCYGKHPNLHIFAREQISYDAMKNVYANVKLIPDMVFSLNRRSAEKTRNGCLLSLRHDQERTRSEEQEAAVRRQVSALFGDRVREADMVTDHCVPVADRERELEARFDLFASSELVVTDRLHGMVFCAITGTPCVVLDSKSPKVRGCYEWIRDLEYIRFVDDPDQIAEAYASIPEKRFCYDNSHLLPYYEELAADIMDIFHWR